MPNTTRVLIAALLLGAAGVLLWEGAFLQAQVGAFQAQVQTFGKIPVNDNSPAPPTVTMLAPPSAPPPLASIPRSPAWARTWLALQQPVDMPFAEETRLEDVLKYLRAKLAEGDKPRISIYLDPVGLQEAEKTCESPVTLEADAVPVATALSLVLKQLGMEYRIQDDGIVVITSMSSSADEYDLQALLASEIFQLRQEIYALRSELATQRGAAGSASPARPMPGSASMTSQGFAGFR